MVKYGASLKRIQLNKLLKKNIILLRVVSIDIIPK